MNLIVSRHLDKAQKQVIYELTLKKRQSKKSFMSEKQVAARQQLARELMLERKSPIEEPLGSLRSAPDPLALYLDRSPAYTEPPAAQASIGRIARARQLDGAVEASSPASSCGCSFSRSDSSYSESSHDSGAQMVGDKLGQRTLEQNKEASIKLNKSRLEQLNSELERRLHQYEYLVSREKALLEAYNIMLFTNEGVNNFHLYDIL